MARDYYCAFELADPTSTLVPTTSIMNAVEDICRRFELDAVQVKSGIAAFRSQAAGLAFADVSECKKVGCVARTVLT